MWTVTFRRARQSPEETTGISAPDMMEAWRAFVTWRIANELLEYYSATAGPTE
jgi:hypothetical protein